MPNKIEEIKRARDGLDVLEDIYRYAELGFDAIPPDDYERMKWYGIFHRPQTPGHFMLRLRLNAGRANAAQLRVIADISDEHGKGFVDLTTRQQVQLRGFTLSAVPEIWRRLEGVGSAPGERER